MDKKISVNKMYLYAIAIFLVVGVFQYFSTINTIQYSKFYTKDAATPFMFARHIISFATRILTFVVVAKIYKKFIKKDSVEVTIKDLIMILAIVWVLGSLVTVIIMAGFVVLMVATGATF